MDQLPTEILVKIFKCLPNETVALSLAPVCKAFRDCANYPGLWTKVRYSYQEETLPSFFKFLQQQKQLQKLELEVSSLGKERGFFYPEIPLPSSLRKLTVRGGHSELKDFSNFYPNLKTVKLVDFKVCFHILLIRSSKGFPELEKLVLENVRFFGWFCNLPDEITLKKLIIRSSLNVDYDVLTQILKKCHHLEQLHLDIRCSISRVLSFLRDLHLKDLAIYNTSVLYFGSTFNTSEYSEFFKRMNDLEACAFGGCRYFDGTYWGADDFDDKVLDSMARYCQKLRVVKLQRLENITQTGIMKMVARLDALTDLWVFDCPLNEPEKLQEVCNRRNVKLHFSQWRDDKSEMN